MNKADNEAGSKAIDSLINYETVKVGLDTMCLPSLQTELLHEFKHFTNIHVHYESPGIHVHSELRTGCIFT